MILDDGIVVGCDWCFAQHEFETHYRHGGPDLRDGWRWEEHVPWPINEACEGSVLLCSDACRTEFKEAVEKANTALVKEWTEERAFATVRRAIAKAKAEGRLLA